MVSFQCEGCGDVQTKKKLDSHRNQCHAPFTCIDCMTTFHGTQYKAHTSCMTEAQKYEGHLYRNDKDPQIQKKSSSKRKSVSILEPSDTNALVRTKHATVEDAYDGEVPPQVPTPPPAVKGSGSNRDSVFDYLVEEEPNTPQIQYANEREEMFMKSGAPSVFGGSGSGGSGGSGSASNSRPTSRSEYRNKEEQLQTQSYQQNGFSYGAEPIKPGGMSHANPSTITLDFMTPAAKVARAKLNGSGMESVGHSRQNSNSEKKRKRAVTDDHASLSGGDVAMADVDAAVPGTIVRSVVDTPGTGMGVGVVHSGLTGGLQRMLTGREGVGDDWGRRTESPEADGDRKALVRVKTGKTTTKHRDHAHEREPASPLKRTRRSKDDKEEKERDAGLGISIKGRAGKVMSMINGALTTNGVESALGKTNSSANPSRRRGSSSDDGRERERERDRDRKDSAKARDRTESEKRERKKHKVTRHNGTSSANVRMPGAERERSSRSKKRGDSSAASSPDVSRSRDHGHHISDRNGKSSAQKQIEYHHRHPPSPSNSPSNSDSEKPNAMIIFGTRPSRKCTDFLEYVSKGPESAKGYSVNKVLKRYHKDSGIVRDGEKREEERDLWRGLRLRRNERGEVVVFVG